MVLGPHFVSSSPQTDLVFACPTPSLTSGTFFPPVRLLCTKPSVSSYLEQDSRFFSLYSATDVYKTWTTPVDQAPVVQRPDNFIRGIRHYSGSKIYFTLNVVQGFRTIPNLAVVRVCIFACTRGNTEIFAQIETVG